MDNQDVSFTPEEAAFIRQMGFIHLVQVVRAEFVNEDDSVRTDEDATEEEVNKFKELLESLPMDMRIPLRRFLNPAGARVDASCALAVDDSLLARPPTLREALQEQNIEVPDDMGFVIDILDRQMYKYISLQHKIGIVTRCFANWDADTHRQNDNFFCPITQSVFQDPVCFADGKTYEREAISSYLAKIPHGHQVRSPYNRQVMVHTLTNPNQCMKSDIITWSEMFVKQNVEWYLENCKVVTRD